MPQELRPGVIPISYQKFFLRITHLSSVILNKQLLQHHICYPHDLFFVLWNLISWIVFILHRKIFLFILHRKIFPIHHTYMTCLFFSFLLIYNKTRPNDFDLQLGCCISDAFSIFLKFSFEIFFWMHV